MAVAHWQTGQLHVAVIEFAEEFPELDARLMVLDPRVHAETMSESPRGCTWYSLRADSLDESDAMHAVTAVLKRLHLDALRGKMPGFRRVTGRWRPGFEATVVQLRDVNHPAPQ